MRFLSVCSGIEAASVAWHPIGWSALAFSEIEAFPRAVLKHHYPDTPLHGDFTALRDEPWIVDADVLVGGTPCQAFSVAGLRKSLSDDRGNLSLQFVRLADAIDDLRRDAGRSPAWICWENVPGVLSTSDNAFGAFLGGLVGSDEPITPENDAGWTRAGVVAGPKRVAAWRILDAQHFGLAQRRQRVFVLALGGSRNWRCADALLPIADSLQGDPPPRREAGKGVTQPVAECLRAGGNGTGGDRPPGTDADTAATYLIPTTFSIMPQSSGKDHKAREVQVAQPVMAGGPVGGNQGGDYIVQPILESGKRTGTSTSSLKAGDGIGSPGDPMFTLGVDSRHAVAFALRGREGGAMPEIGGDQVGALRSASGGSSRDYVAFAQNSRDELREMPYVGALAAEAGMKQTSYIRGGSAVRRLTPRECERLQGFPDDYTLIPWRKGVAPDGPRYKALGNSMAVPVMAWIGRRIAAVDALETVEAAA